MSRPTMTDGHRLSRILVPTDFSEGSRRALLRAARLPLDWDAVIHPVHVLPAGVRAESLRVAAEEALAESVEVIVEALTRAGRDDVRVQSRLEQDRPFVGVVRAADELDVDLIVAGRRGERGLRDVLLGSTSDRIIRNGGRPVLLVARSPSGPYKHSAASVDLGEPMVPVLEWTIRLAPADAIDVAHSYEVPHKALLIRGGLSDEELREQRKAAKAEARDRLNQELEAAAAALQVEPGTFRPVLKSGDPRRTIPQWVGQTKVDLVALGTHARGPLAHAVLGSVAEELIRLIPCDTLVVPPRKRRASPKR